MNDFEYNEEGESISQQKRFDHASISCNRHLQTDTRRITTPFDGCIIGIEGINLCEPWDEMCQSSYIDDISPDKGVSVASNRYSVVDLFCGCGGFSRGFYQAGYDIKLGVDMWSDAIDTYKRNFPDAKTINSDITRVDDCVIRESTNLDSVDVVIGGPPCQGFSVSGKRLIDDPRNSLYKSFVRIVGGLQPKAFVMENVPGLVKLFNGAVKENVINDFTEMGYNVNCKELVASDYGVPQKRKRVFFVGLRRECFGEDAFFEYPEATTHDQPLTCRDAISDLDFVPDDVSLGDCISYGLPPQNDYQKKMRDNSESLKNHAITLHTERTRDIISLVPDGGNYKSLPAELQRTRKVNIAWTRMDSGKPCFTIDTGHNHHFHYRANRVPTVRESARLQSFPDEFEITGIKTSQLKQVGNAVPPLLSEAIARQLHHTMERYDV